MPTKNFGTDRICSALLELSARIHLIQTGECPPETCRSRQSGSSHNDHVEEFVQPGDEVVHGCGLQGDMGDAVNAFSSILHQESKQMQSINAAQKEFVNTTTRFDWTQ